MVTFRLTGWILVVCAASLSAGCNAESDPSRTALSPALPPLVSVAKPRPKTDERPLVQVTPQARESIQKIIADQGLKRRLYLRVRVVPGGCCGFLHKLDLDPFATAEDYTFESGGVQVVVFKRQMDMLRGSQVDFVNEKDRQGFKITNPNFEGEASRKWMPLLEKETDTK